MMQLRAKRLSKLARRFSKRRDGELFDDLYKPRPRDRRNPL